MGGKVFSSGADFSRKLGGTEFSTLLEEKSFFWGNLLDETGGKGGVEMCFSFVENVHCLWCFRSTGCLEWCFYGVFCIVKNCAGTPVNNFLPSERNFHCLLLYIIGHKIIMPLSLPLLIHSICKLLSRSSSSRDQSNFGRKQKMQPICKKISLRGEERAHLGKQNSMNFIWAHFILQIPSASISFHFKVAPLAAKPKK